MGDTKEAASQSAPIGLISRPEPTKVDTRLETFRHWIKEQGLKETAQRDEIAKVFLASNRHMSVEELVHAVREVSPRVSYATVYRTMRLLMECGFAEERHFADGQARFENIAEAGHHDHLICERCGRIVEFIQPRIEQLQEELAKRSGFVSTTHKMEIYGICQDCREGRT
jgi:Fur family ferric uptake transcriptional regulator